MDASFSVNQYKSKQENFFLITNSTNMKSLSKTFPVKNRAISGLKFVDKKSHTDVTLIGS